MEKTNNWKLATISMILLLVLAGVVYGLYKWSESTKNKAIQEGVDRTVDNIIGRTKESGEDGFVLSDDDGDVIVCRYAGRRNVSAIATG